MVTVMVRPLVWFVLKVKPILLVTLQVKIHTHQPDLIQGSDSTVEIQDQGNPLEGVLVEGIQTMKSRRMNLHLCRDELRTRMVTETTPAPSLPHIEGKEDPESQTHLLLDIHTMTPRTHLTHHIRLTTQLSL